MLTACIALSGWTAALPGQQTNGSTQQVKQTGSTPISDPKGLIARAMRVMVASLDSTLPAVPFDRWLAQVRGGGSEITWEVNDCGEGGDGRQAPTCVEAILRLTSDSTAHASIVVADIDGKRFKPSVWYLTVGTGYLFTAFKTLHEWAAYVRTHGH